MTSAGGQHRLVGAWGEEQAARYLRRRRYTILDVNYHSRFGEIDLICQKGNTLVFVEVKLRKDENMASPSAFVTPSKQQKIIRTALCYLSAHPSDCQIRFDVLEIVAPEGAQTKRPQVRHLENAFDAAGEGF